MVVVVRRRRRGADHHHRPEVVRVQGRRTATRLSRGGNGPAAVVVAEQVEKRQKRAAIVPRRIEVPPVDQRMSEKKMVVKVGLAAPKTVVGGALVRPQIRDLRSIIVNLERRPDRLYACLDRLESACPELSCSRFVATDGKATCISESEVVTSWNTARNCVYQRIRSRRKGWNDLASYRELTLTLSPGERGCASSHIRAWTHCLELAQQSNHDRPLLVLEDDAAPTPEFREVLRRALDAVPADAHVLYLGYSQAADWRREISPDVVEAEYVWTTVAYVIWPAGARYLLGNLPVDQPVDNWMAGHNASGGLKAYCTRPKIVLQAEPWNVNSDVMHSDEHYWGTDSDIHHSDEFYWGPLPLLSGIAPASAGINGGGDLGLAPAATMTMLGSLAGGSLWEAASDASDDDSMIDEDL